MRGTIERDTLGRDSISLRVFYGRAVQPLGIPLRVPPLLLHQLENLTNPLHADTRPLFYRKQMIGRLQFYEGPRSHRPAMHACLQQKCVWVDGDSGTEPANIRRLFHSLWIVSESFFAFKTFAAQQYPDSPNVWFVLAVDGDLKASANKVILTP